MIRALKSVMALMLLTSGAARIMAEPSPSMTLEAMEKELSRSMTALSEQAEPPYFLSYEINDVHSARVAASFGMLTRSEESRHRLLDIDLRVGDHSFDNTHPLRDDRFLASTSWRMEVPLEDAPDAIRNILWYHTDKKYKEALEQYTRVKTNVRVKVEEEDQSADFSHEAAARHIETPLELIVDRGIWEEKIKRYTAPFIGHGDIYEAGASFTADRENRYYINSEGARIQTTRTTYALFISAFTKAEDGMELPRREHFFAYDMKALPDDATILAVVKRMIQELQALREAPIVEPYTGPALLSGRASGVFFHEIFGHRVEGHRQRQEDDAQTFKKMINKAVLPEGFSVVFDPTIRAMAGTDLAGHYLYDNEGVKARRVAVVEDGILRRFLMSRKPIEGFAASNGHGRRQPGFRPVSRQSNLIVEVSQPVGKGELKEMLLERVRGQGLPFGLLFDDIEGGFTFTGRLTPNAFNVRPIMVYRVFSDGREELVRGVDLIGTPLTAFSKIVAGDDQLGVFNGTCGAESGGVPVSAISPNLLVSQIEVQKKEKSQERPPLLPPPSTETEN